MKKLLILFTFLFLYSCDSDKCEDRLCNCEPSPRYGCQLIPDAGPCDAYIPKYYFDMTAGKCKEFIWGGCEGVVPFNTMEECQQCEQKAAQKK